VTRISRVIVLAESDADRRAVSLLCEHFAPGVSFDDHFVADSFDRVRQALPSVLHQVATRRLDAHAVVVVVDGDNCPASRGVPRSRTDAMHQLIAKAKLSQEVPVALGVAAPAIEAWLLFNRLAGLNESGWESSLSATGCNPRARKQELKRELYGESAGVPGQRGDMMVAAMRELIDTGAIAAARAAFPAGLDAFLKTIESWRSEAPE
jgi:hypothetical protein